ncbi:hypothetical protein [Cohaesibacter celericrescens]|uniref:Uncharacterized protein n=1 Tax=Cohaesibacter celericrescens TaxID=2067669 RepID=A0A2N5XTY9_9HYPH|nr:hypothetical protein [Cohaesibacter celericrescens]PLW77878.1 hypothetical protein C0081_07060 [Cohaesibacter celericrescens]
MTNEMNDVTRSIVGVNAMNVAMAVGHVAALALVTQMRDGGREENELYYRLFKPLEEERETEQDIELMAQYVADRPENVSGEQLFRKCAELAIHDAPAGSFFDQSIEVQIGYRLFAKSCRLVAVDLQIEQREEQSRLERAKQERRPIPFEDQTYAADEGPLVKDPVHEAAQKAIAEMPITKAAIKEPVQQDDAPEQPMSIGERPVAHQGKAKRGGARVPKTAPK